MKTRPPLEYSEDRQRGSMSHIRQSIAALGTLDRCVRHAHRPATHALPIRERRVGICAACAQEYASLSPLERRRGRLEFTR